MSQRRMFSPEIVCSDAFLDMPPTSRDLYYQLCMYADDDGFISPRKIMRMIGSSEDDLKIIIAKRFVLPFESGVVVIKHWLIHNLIRADLYHETLHKEEKAKLGLNKNGAYTEMRDDANLMRNDVSELKVIEPPEWLKKRRNEQRTANVPQTALRLGKDRLVNNDQNPINTETQNIPILLEEKKGEKKFPEDFENFWKIYPRKVGKLAALKSWEKISPNLELQNKMKETVELQKKTDQWKKENGQYIPHPSTWLNQGRWDDDVGQNKSTRVLK